MKDARSIGPTPVRIPPDLRQWLKHKAVDNYRSLNSEILIRLEESRKRDEQEQADAQR